MEKWFVAAKRADFAAWGERFGIDPVVARIIRNRDITDPEGVERFLHGTLKDCYSPWRMAGMERAAALILEAIEQGTSLRVIGDYDVDGVCASYILLRGLEALGAKVDAAIPHRIKDGYGLSEDLIREAAGAGVGMVITCDNGIAAAEPIALAGSLGIRTVVTDHHEVPFVEEGGLRRQLLPPADAVVDPRQEACTYPFPSVCGAVVAWKLIQALCEKKPAAGQEELFEDLIQMAALATVCDVMELRDENRIIVKEGLARMRRTQNPGLRALIEVNELDGARLNVYHLGFVLGPCLNATGRLDTALRGLELLRSSTKMEAMTVARELLELNNSRKNLTQKGVEAALEQIRERRLDRDPVMLIYLPELHESLAGIVAGKIREIYHHPVLVLTRGEQGVKGSGRSIEAYHMYDSLTAVKHYFTRYGGHRLAAGLSMREEDIESLRRDLNERSSLTEADFIPQVHIDVPMPMDYATFSLARELELLEPCGAGNPRPLFAQREVCFVEARRIGRGQNYARLTALSGRERLEVMFFGDVDAFCGFLEEKYGPGSAAVLFEGRALAACGGYRVSITYQLGIHSYRGRESLQFIMENYC